MPVEFGLWRLDNGKVEPVNSSALAHEEKLEDIIQERIDILGRGQLLVVGRQVVTDYQKRIDLLAMDQEGDLHVIELKKDRTPRDIVAQALEYGWWVQQLTWDRIGAIYAKHNDDADLSTAFSEAFDAEIPEIVNTAHHLVVVASQMDSSTEQIVDYVRDYNVPINVLFFQYLEDGDRQYLARSWLADPEVVPAGAGGKKQPPWSGKDFFVVVGENQHRNWDDMRRYGYVSAGHGDKYRKAMSNLFPGARVWAYIPQTGYVGVGEVVEEAVGPKDFMVDVDGKDVPILEADLKTEHLEEDADDPENAEYLARVEWYDTRPREAAIREKGMFANQNVVAKLRHPFTLQRLAEEFDADDVGAPPASSVSLTE